MLRNPLLRITLYAIHLPAARVQPASILRHAQRLRTWFRIARYTGRQITFTLSTFS
jgi:hypothetical protein